MSSHDKHHRKTYEYKVISSHDLKKRDHAAIGEHLNTLGAKGWDVVTISMSESNSKGISFLGLMKRKVYDNEHHSH